MLLTPETVTFVKPEEGCRLKAYLDKPKNGTWTIGYGQTMYKGRKVQPGDTMTQAEAESGLRVELQYVQNHVVAMIKPAILAKLKPTQITALVSLAYNIGLDENHDGIAQGFGDSTLLKKLNAGDFKGAAAEFPKWCRSGSDPTLLLARREREQKEFLA